MNKWPTKDEPDNKYKFGSVYFELSQDESKIERQTYSFLEWLGEVGGLFEISKVIGFFIVLPFSSYRIKSELLSAIFRYLPRF